MSGSASLHRSAQRLQIVLHCQRSVPAAGSVDSFLGCPSRVICLSDRFAGELAQPPSGQTDLGEQPLHGRLRTHGSKQGRATHGGVFSYAALVTMLAASSLQNNSLFPRFDVVEERFIHVDDDDRLTAEAVNKNVAHPTEKDCSSMRCLDLGDAVRHLIAAPRKVPALPKGSAPTLGGLRTSQSGGDVRVVGRQGQVVETSQKKLQAELERTAPASHPGSIGAQLRLRNSPQGKSVPAAADDPADWQDTVPRLP